MSEEHHRLALPQGTRIRDFEFHRVLGRGGFGMTYLGWNIALDIPVAIKEYLPADLATREQDLSVVPQSSQAVADFQWGLERFLDEARTLARFQHPNIVRVHHFFEAHSTAYIVMDYVEGEDLSAYLTRKGTLSEDELKRILYPLLSALEMIHRADFLHRDIKPGNIVLRDSDDSPVLLDFGAARQATGAKSRSVTSIVTPGYAPIEQYSSRGRQGAWTDIYALGGVCYRALTGQVPEDATDRMRNDPLIPVSQRCAGRVSDAFLSAIDVALSVDEGDRPQSVEAWRAVMEADAAGSATIAYTAPQADLVQDMQKFVAEMGRKPSPNAVDNKGVTDLHHAAALNLPALALSLLDQGAEIEAKAILHASISPQLTAFLNKIGEEDHETGGCTPLHVAALTNSCETAETLLKNGADVHAEDDEGGMSLHYAMVANTSDTMQVLLDYGADVHAKDDDEGWVLLHMAALANASDTVQVLLANGADVHAKDNNGLTPLHVAAGANADTACGGFAE